MEPKAESTEKFKGTEPMENTKQHEGRIIQSVERAIQIVLLFLHEGGELGIKDFAERMNLPKSTIHSLVNTLAAYKFLEQDPENSKYHLGSTLFRLGLQYTNDIGLISSIDAYLERLSYKFNVHVNICMLMGSQVVVSYNKTPDNPLVKYPETGVLVPIHSTANGKILLAFADEETREQILAEYIFDSHTPHTITSREKFLGELEKVKEEGIAFSIEESVEGISAMAAPVYNRHGEVVASFGLSAENEFFSDHRNEILLEMKNTVKLISKQMGHRI